jgi:hypothetical protein
VVVEVGVEAVALLVVDSPSPLGVVVAVVGKVVLVVMAESPVPGLMLVHPVLQLLRGLVVLVKVEVVPVVPVALLEPMVLLVVAELEVEVVPEVVLGSI